MKNKQVIECPHCHKEISLDEALTHQISENLRKDLEAGVKKKDAEFAEKAQALAVKEEALDKTIAEKAKAEAEKLVEQAEAKAKESVEVELKDLQTQVKERTQALKDAQKHELELRKKQRELEERAENMDLEVARKLDKETKVIKEEAGKAADEAHRLKDLENEKQMNDMRKQIDDLKRKSEQSSQQTQGEVLELELEATLTAAFPFDQIEEVKKGKNGADVVQRVCDNLGRDCGAIIWESKNTKAWGGDWIRKLKEDQARQCAEIGVLLSMVLPKGMDGFGPVEGIWVTNFRSTVGLAAALRQTLIETANARVAATGKNEKMEYLYAYLTGTQFRQRVQAIVETFQTMHQELDRERTVIQKTWAKREKQISKIISNTTGMYGDLQGLVGSSLPQIEALELEALTAGESSDE